MGWRKVLFVDHVVSALHHPKSRVVSGFGFCLFLSLFVFYVFAPVLTGSADGGVPPIFVWFSPFSSASGGPRDVGVLVGKEGGVGAAAGIDGHGGNSSGNPHLVESGHGEGNRAVKPPEDDGTAEAKGSGGKGGILGERNSTETRKPVESDGDLRESRSTETNDSVQQDGILRGTQNGTGSVSNKGTILEKNLDGSPLEDGKLSNSSGKGSVSGGNPEKDFSSAPKNATFSGRSEYPAGNSSVSSKQAEAGESSSSGKCDIFDGKWVRDERKPFYPPGSCPYIHYSFNCQKNGRPDRKYLKWRWQPNGCNIPRLNATDFLVQLQGKRIVFVGDSLNRNMWESLVCILRHSVANKKRVFEISGRSQFKTRGYYSFKFKDYDCSVDFVKSPFLVRESIVNRGNGAESDKLRLDVMDDTTSAYKNADIVVFNTGHWWTHEKTSQGINYYQEGNYVYPVLKAMDAYEKALKTWAKWVDKNIHPMKTRVFFRGYSLTHFRGGQWNSGGKCHKETEPIFNETFLKNYPLQMTIVESVIKKMKTPMMYLNVSRLTDYRKDGHPSIYRKKYISEEEQKAAVRSQDCSHWCLPGIPDTWNELLYASLLMDGKGLWRN